MKQPCKSFSFFFKPLTTDVWVQSEDEPSPQLGKLQFLGAIDVDVADGSDVWASVQLRQVQDNDNSKGGANRLGMEIGEKGLALGNGEHHLRARTCSTPCTLGFSLLRSCALY
ncbi:hypothetical protein GYH30_000673 [Glycine max]|nr:hypothetical protein GYH30_000673 [Glycine max]